MALVEDDEILDHQVLGVRHTSKVDEVGELLLHAIHGSYVSWSVSLDKPCHSDIIELLNILLVVLIEVN
jgi:hypothetical protein